MLSSHSASTHVISGCGQSCRSLAIEKLRFVAFKLCSASPQFCVLLFQEAFCQSLIIIVHMVFQDTQSRSGNFRCNEKLTLGRWEHPLHGIGSNSNSIRRLEAKAITAHPCPRNSTRSWTENDIVPGNSRCRCRCRFCHHWKPRRPLTI